LGELVDDLSEGELHALRNLAEKRTGTVTPFLNIADAQRLTELGLAVRSRQGWDITPEGSALLARLAAYPGGARSDEGPADD
jgi:hypothetical protein